MWSIRRDPRDDYHTTQTLKLRKLSQIRLNRDNSGERSGGGAGAAPPPDRGFADPGRGGQAMSLMVSWTPDGSVAKATGVNSVPEPSASKNSVSPC